jgi:hypothetical protein
VSWLDAVTPAAALVLGYVAGRLRGRRRFRVVIVVERPDDDEA